MWPTNTGVARAPVLSMATGITPILIKEATDICILLRAGNQPDGGYANSLRKRYKRMRGTGGKKTVLRFDARLITEFVTKGRTRTVLQLIDLQKLAPFFWPKI